VVCLGFLDCSTSAGYRMDRPYHTAVMATSGLQKDTEYASSAVSGVCHTLTLKGDGFPVLDLPATWSYV